MIATLVPVEGTGPAFAQAFLLFLALGGLVANQCHKWAHLSQSDLGRLARNLQRQGLSLSPEAHRVHHARPHDSHYCTASGWMNGPLESIAFFRRLEAVVTRFTRLQPRSNHLEETKCTPSSA